MKQQEHQPFWFDHKLGDSLKILIAEDEELLRSLLHSSLESSGYQVSSAANGRAALEVFASENIDLVLLDIIMPVMDGFETCKAIRQQSDVPIVLLTALSRPDDIVGGFELGADDYITKPFTFGEVEVRLQAIFRRIGWLEDPRQFPVIEFDGFVFDDMARKVIINEQAISLTPIECKLLGCLMSTPNRPRDKHELFRVAWGYEVDGGKNLVEVAIRRLRQKVEQNPSTPKHLVTVRGSGYKFMPPQGETTAQA